MKASPTRSLAADYTRCQLHHSYLEEKKERNTYERNAARVQTVLKIYTDVTSCAFRSCFIFAREFLDGANRLSKFFF